jgi:hypothetical protein
MAILPMGARFEHPSASSAKPHFLSYATARTVADDALFELWNGATDSARVFRVNLDGQVQAQDGAVGTPGYSFEDDKDSGLYRIGANNIGLAVGGAKVVDIGAAGVTVTGTLGSTGLATLASLAVTGAATLNGDTTVGNAAGDALTFHPSAWTLTNAVTVTGTWTDLGVVTTVDINGGTIDGVTIGATAAPTVTNLGSVATCDINGGTIDGAVIGGASAAAGTFTTLVAGTSLNPDANDGAGLGTGALGWSDLFLASGGVINWANGDAVLTHSTGILTVSTGDLRVTTAGTNAASAVTVGGTQTLTNKTLTSPTIGGDLTVDNLNVNGNTISATSGALNLTPAPGSAIVLDGAVNVDAGVVTGITALTATQITGTLQTAAQPSVTSLGTLTALATEAASVYIGDTANTHMTVGLTINQGANDDNILAFKSSDVSHGAPHPEVEDDDWLTVEKLLSSAGGARFRSLADSDGQTTVLSFEAYGGTGDTGKGTSDLGLIDLYATQHDGLGGLSDIEANGNVLSVRGRVGGANRTLFIIDEDGDFHYDGADGGAFDAEDDVALARAFALATSKDVIRSEFDDFVRYNEADLVRLGILGDTVERGGLVNGAQLQRLHTGAIWQTATRTQRLEDEVELHRDALRELLELNDDLRGGDRARELLAAR